MELRLELLSKHNCLLGIEYRSGVGTTVEEKPVVFHEFSIGIIFATLFVTFY